MSFATEWLFVLLLVGLYLHDSAALLYDNEVLLEWRRRPRMRFGADNLRVLRRQLVVPNPATPWRPLFRLSWHAQDGTIPQDAELAPTDFTRIASKLAPSNWFLPPIAVGLFVGIPLCLFFDANWRPFLTVVAFIYAGIAAALVNLWRARGALGIAGRRFAALAFECLACPPCALNLMRRVTLALPIAEDASRVARRVLSSAEAGRVVGEILRRVDAELEETDEGSRQWQRLTDYRKRLAEALP